MINRISMVCYAQDMIIHIIIHTRDTKPFVFSSIGSDPSSRFVYLRSESNESIQSAHFRSESESLGIPIEYRTKGGGDLGMYPNRRRGTFHHIEQNTPGVGLCVRWCCRQSQQVPAIAVAYTAMPEFPVSKQFSTAIFR